MFSTTGMSYRKVVLFALLLALFGSLLVPFSAQATVQSTWPTASGANTLQVGPDNYVRTVNCGYDGRIHRYDEFGAEQADIQGSGGDLLSIGCDNFNTLRPQWPTDTISPSGNTAVAVYTDSNSNPNRVRLYDSSGTQLWEHLAKDECDNDAVVKASPIVANGVVAYTYASCLNWGDYNIVGLDEANGDVIYETSIGYVPDWTTLSWYEDGISFRTGSEWRYISNSGVEDMSRRVNTLGGQQIAQHVDGSVVYLRYDDTLPDTCYIVFHTYGVTDVQKGVDCGELIADAKTMPNGDLVYVSDNGYESGTATIKVVHKSLSQADTLINVSEPVDTLENSFIVFNFFVDANGKIVVPMNYTEIVDEGAWTERYISQAAFKVYSSNGVAEFQWSSGVFGDEDFYTSTEVSMSLANGGVYIIEGGGDSRAIFVNIPLLSMSFHDSQHWDLPAYAYQGVTYVALGDSYSSGEGSFNYDIDDGRCHRSSNAYAFDIAEELQMSAPVLAACSGAVSDDIDPASSISLGQIDMIGVNTEYVTLTIGGNDAGFVSVMTACVDHMGNEGYGCSDNNALTAPLSERMQALAGNRPSNLGTLYAPDSSKPIHSIEDVLLGIAVKAPNAEIYIAGYPEMFGENSIFYEFDPLVVGDYTCVVNTAPYPRGEVRISLHDAVWLNDQARLLNTIISDAVDTVALQGKDVHYVPITNFDTHGICDTSYSWINDIDLESGSFAPLAESFHPNHSGMYLGYASAFIDEMED